MARKLEEIEANQRVVLSELGRLKAAVIKHVPADEAQALFHQEQYDDSAEFENFCSKLEDDPVFKELFVSMFWNVI
jgi:hypothetical protein